MQFVFIQCPEYWLEHNWELEVGWNMKIVFGMYLDGVPWTNKSASIGEIRTGPFGFLSILETRLGLSGISVHPVHRIDEYMKRMKAIDNDSAWFHNSFAADPWSTARQLLMWRDELIEAGWQGNPDISGSARLKALAELEVVDTPLSPGRPESLQEVIRQLEQGAKVDIAKIEMVEPLDLLPPVWRKLMKLLQAQGITLAQRPLPNPGQQKSNLAAIQRAVLGNGSKDSLSSRDDSLILLKADNEWQAAEHLALWLAAEPNANDQVTIICGSGTGILDQVLKRHGLPCLGRSEVSRWREIQQILPLMLANVWKPADVGLLVEMLSLTIPPFPRWVCRVLLRAITKEPGLDGKAWKAALDEIENRRQEELAKKGDALSAEKARQYVEDIQAILVTERYDPVAGIPENVLRDRCQKVINWLGWRLESNPMLAEVVSQAREIQAIAIGKGNIPRNTLERMLDTVIGGGSDNLDSCEEAGLWRVVDHPGQIIDACPKVIWWGFNDPMVKPPTYWSKPERNDLQAAAVHIEESKLFRHRDAMAWQQGFLNVGERFMAIHITRMEGAPISHHPYWDTICQAAAQVGKGYSEEETLKCLVRECKEFENDQNWAFSGRNHTLRIVDAEEALDLVAAYTVPASVIGPPGKLSYSQMSTLIACPMKWALQYHANLSLPESQMIPSGNQMLGTFCHRIVEELYATQNHWQPDAAAREAGIQYNRLVPSMASELLLEGKMIENRRYKEEMIRAVKLLVEAINKLGLTVEATEAPLQGEVNGIPLTGYADLLLRDNDGHPFVLDMKWSKSVEYRRQEVVDGTALQLATYAWMLRSADAVQDAHAGYFMLAQGRLISDSQLLGNDAVVSAKTLEEIWDMAAASLDNVLNDFDNGLLKAHGVDELMQVQNGEKLKDVQARRKEEYLVRGMLYQGPSCQRCDFSRLCGWAGGII